MIPKVVAAAAIAALAARTVTALPLSEPNVSTKIVGGNEAPDTAFPFIVSILSNGGHLCGGSLVNNDTVLTASHCIDGKNSATLQVRAGSRVSSISSVNLLLEIQPVPEALDPNLILLRVAEVRARFRT